MSHSDRSSQRAALIWQFKDSLMAANNLCINNCLNSEFSELKDIEKVCLSKCFDRSNEYKFQFLGKLTEGIRTLNP